MQARDGWLDSVLSAIPNDDAHQHATKCLEQLRVHLFDVCTQYRAVFADDEPTTANARLRRPDALPTNLPAIYHCWMLRKVNVCCCIIMCYNVVLYNL